MLSHFDAYPNPESLSTCKEVRIGRASYAFDPEDAAWVAHCLANRVSHQYPELIDLNKTQEELHEDRAVLEALRLVVTLLDATNGSANIDPAPVIEARRRQEAEAYE